MNNDANNIIGTLVKSNLMPVRYACDNLMGCGTPEVSKPEKAD